MRQLLFSSTLAALMISSGAALAGPSLLVDLDTGKVLQHDDAFVPWHPASLTKLMTTYVTYRAIAAGEITMLSPVRVSERAAKEPPSKMGFKPGSVLTVDNAIKILMVKSANDIATSLAESVAGSSQAFVARMNAEARRIGMSDTRFANAHGLHVDDQVTTARDLAILAMTMRNEFPQYDDYYTLEAISTGNALIENHNNLVMRFDGATGMKTGYTCPSGFNLVGTARRGSRNLMAIVIGEHTVEERDDKAANMLVQGFDASEDSAPYLGQLRPTGTEPKDAANLRPVICTEAHWKAVSERRGPSGKLAFTSPYLPEPTRAPVPVAVALGGATGPESPAPRYADVPIPTPRPADYTPVTATAEGG
ncbi:D-alanyl-D-alanine carboxypeptidase family protein [Mesorhizobium sp. CAU 1741]|uniref:D-alanyl-D-alanine carboxypeptidase family protein n=1 Tax=Mesorhizobium sp. CAU 1741 TaxID=3140366 RepID=UPI00325BBC84